MWLQRLAKLTAGGEAGFPPMVPGDSLQDILPDTEEEFGVFLERLVAATKASPVSPTTHHSSIVSDPSCVLFLL